MTTMEFGEIRETWMELMDIYDEIDALNAEPPQGTGLDASAAKAASAR